MYALEQRLGVAMERQHARPVLLGQQPRERLATALEGVDRTRLLAAFVHRQHQAAVHQLLVEDDGASDLAKLAAPRRTRCGSVSRLEQQLDAIARLPKASQKPVWQVLDAMIAQAAA